MPSVHGLTALIGRARRVPRVGYTQLTSKNGPRNFYKGKGVPSVGRKTSKGRSA